MTAPAAPPCAHPLGDLRPSERPGDYAAVCPCGKSWSFDLIIGHGNPGSADRAGRLVLALAGRLKADRTDLKDFIHPNSLRAWYAQHRAPEPQVQTESEADKDGDKGATWGRR